jgi:hypothetical protein
LIITKVDRMLHLNRASSSAVDIIIEESCPTDKLKQQKSLYAWNHPRATMGDSMLNFMGAVETASRCWDVMIPNQRQN